MTAPIEEARARCVLQRGGLRGMEGSVSPAVSPANKVRGATRLKDHTAAATVKPLTNKDIQDIAAYLHSLPGSLVLQR